MGSMIVELQVMEQNSVFGMIEFYQMLKRPRRFLTSGFDVVYLHRFDVNGVPRLSAEKSREAERIGEGRESRKHDQSCF